MSERSGGRHRLCSCVSLPGAGRAAQPAAGFPLASLDALVSLSARRRLEP